MYVSYMYMCVRTVASSEQNCAAQFYSLVCALPECTDIRCCEDAPLHVVQDRRWKDIE